ncbi:EAL domain-containing protein [Sphingomonas sp. NY01]|uniref:EAL domain-containing protein n=1 Tax=Sphingomonas sp. NY01 TaxID=2968057 RepID=UPI00315D5FA3
MPRSAFLDGPVSIACLLGLVEDERDQVAILQHVRQDQLAATWPFAVVAQAAASAFLIVMLARSGQTAALMPAALFTGLALLLSGSSMPLLRWMVRERWHPFQRHRVLATVAALLAATLTMQMWIATDLPDPVRLGCMVALAGAIGLSVVAAHDVRPMTLGLAAGLALTIGALKGVDATFVTALSCLGALILVNRRLGLVDRATADTHAQESAESRTAAKMVAEFENQGTGWFWETDRHGRVTYLTDKVAADLARCGMRTTDAALADLFRVDALAPRAERTLAFHLASRTAFSDYSVCAAADAEGARWWSISGRPMIDSLGRFQGFIGSGTDLTEKRRSQAEITRLALSDSLTGLANRQRMRTALDKTLARDSGPYRPASLFLLDLDRFKAVNDTLGHQAGDTLLKQVARRLEECVGDAGLVGRLGGDEFQVLLPDIDARERLGRLARTIITALSQPYMIDDGAVTIGCSIGIAMAPHHGEDGETLVRNADLALYAAKGDGRGVHRFYADEMLEGARTRQRLESDLREALAQGSFHLAYQPIVATGDARIVGYEALLRWTHPTRGAVSPAEFVPIAEECGLIEPLGEWVLRTACREAARWPGGVRVAVNVSPIQFANRRLPDLVASALAHAGLAPDRLELEITEGVFLDGSTDTDQMFKALKGLGIRLALDDFGTGYSSLGYLRTAPIDKIKIDQSFVRGTAQPGNRNAAIVRAIVTLADTLGMETTAEGVEHQDEIALLADLGCSHIQGFVYGQPANADDALAQLSARRGYATASGFRVSRAPRVKMLRSARVAVRDAGGAVIDGDVRIRDMSATGAMIDGLAIDGEAVGVDLLIELLEDQMFTAQVRWARDGRAGIQFAEHFNLERLNPPARSLRQAGER